MTGAYLTSTPSNGLGRTGLGLFSEADTILFTFARSITAFAVDVNTFSTRNDSYTARLSTGDVAQSRFEAFSGTATGQFIEFASDTPFTSVLFGGGVGANAYTLDTLIYGQRETVLGAVPEPATWAMMIVGFGVTGDAMRFARRRRKTDSSPTRPASRDDRALLNMCCFRH